MSLLDETIDWLEKQSHGQNEYLQSARDLCRDTIPIVNANARYKEHNVLRRILIPNKIHHFKIEWEDDNHNCRVNTGWRVQHNNALGPYKGGTRFTPSCSESVLKFLALEQSFKNSLTGLNLGAGKGGANANVKQMSKSELRRFSKAYMQSLHAYIGDMVDVPAGDINVGPEQIAWMFGEYLKQTNSYEGALSGKPVDLAGSQLRKQATGFGVIYFLREVLQELQQELSDTSIAISGAGNVALHTALKASQLGASVKTLSSSSGAYIDESGISESDIKWLINNKDNHSMILKDLAERSSGTFLEDEHPWSVKVDVVIPCATQNEIHKDLAQTICKNETKVVIEGANMPCSSGAGEVFKESNVLWVPGKAANAGGVILSGFEMQQNAALSYRNKETLDEQLQSAISKIHKRCIDESKIHDDNKIDYQRSANVAAFRRLADAVIALGY
ncbi:Glu/Leu/Phe/Val dehydrogenase dimerization domain-containing protein [Ningiella sp. W23]|uniref:Glu/Leu/Phe/Val dehydrogenase dimerization domain-containing protein n=1 Tax=Ningiella sp. W23 TaxID=3023715 RepID=UPI003757B87A